MLIIKYQLQQKLIRIMYNYIQAQEYISIHAYSRNTAMDNN